MNPQTGNPDMAPETAIYSDIPEIEQRLLKVLPDILTAGFILEDSRQIPYGVRLQFQSGETAFGLAVYYSKKKGHSTVIDAGIAPALAARVRLLMSGGGSRAFISPFPQEQSFSSWIGCDEGGKGAFTGPLVAVAYLCDSENARELYEMGVADSKSMDAARLRKLLASITKRFSRRIAVMELKPETYNRLYDDFKAQNKSLNHLLAWAHGKAVEKLMPAGPEAIVIDQFAYPGVIRSRIPTGPKLIIRTKAEDNIAVAAASVVAAGRYLEALNALSKEFDVKIMPGAGATADQSVRAAVAKHGPDILSRLVKMHFVNCKRIL